MICQFCKEDKVLCNAHIIPESFYREILPDDGNSLLVINPEVPFNQRSRKGDYDSEILCHECDKRIGKWDDAGISFFRNSSTWEHLTFPQDPNISGYQVNDYDYPKLKLFFISLLWRASISKRGMWSDVDLGPLNEKALLHLQNEDPGDDDTFAVILLRFKPTKNPHFEQSKETMHKVILGPSRKRFGSTLYYRFQLNENTVQIKASNQRVAQSFRIGCLSSTQRPLFIFERNFDESSELATLKRSIKRKVKLMKAR